MNNKVKSLHEQVAAALIEKLEKGTAPWQKPWNSSSTDFNLPYNALTGNRYKGINIFSLLNAGREDPRWLTFKQADAKGWQVNKGEKGTLVQFVKTHDLVPKLDEKGNKVLDENGKTIKVKTALERAIVTAAWVFNAEQISGIPKLEVQPQIKSEWDPVVRAEDLVLLSGAVINHKKGDEAYYSLRSDSITMPLKEQFATPDRYYATLLHELGHWTGHEDRLNRSLFNRFGSENYAREELRAEIASMLIGDEFKIGHDPGQHVAYVKSWIEILKNNPFEIHAAATDAEKIFNYLLDFERKRELNQNIENRNQQKIDSKLFIGDIISYKDSVYKIVGQLKRGRLQVEEQNTETKFVLSKSDKLYQSLLEAKNGMEEKMPIISTLKEEVQKASYGLKR
ncbi:ArdC family protein [Sphingobacterium siyangense]|uniref:Antirestriction protein ArdC n=1 Tax=Sphingobacterium siyangense TaxID=459529 RepID=A0A562M6G9_9SPHI|nr:zincin-like metallopeptidase domain-containing protein [Sphingobacterium siyangense]TWI15519.1 antirestriction protein ArdC [Sphingobacterium siyangense]